MGLLQELLSELLEELLVGLLEELLVELLVEQGGPQDWWEVPLEEQEVGPSCNFIFVC